MPPSNPLGTVPSSNRLGVANTSAPYLPSHPTNAANWGSASWAQAILGLPAMSPVYQQAITHGKIFWSNSDKLADWGSCGGGSDDGATSVYGSYSTSVLRQVLANDSNYSKQNLTRQNVNGEWPNAWLFDNNGSSGSHSATQSNQLYYFGNEIEQYTTFCSASAQACSCGFLVRTYNWGSQILPNYDPVVNYLPYSQQPYLEYGSATSIRPRAAALARAFLAVKNQVEGLNRGHIVLPPSTTDPFVGGSTSATRPYWNDFFRELKIILGLGNGATLPGATTRALHFHCYSPMPYIPGQSMSPLESMAATAGRIKIGVNWYVATHGADRNFNILLSEFGPLWQSKYGLYYSTDYRPKIMAGFWNHYRDGLEWWNTLLCWITRCASSQCLLQGSGVGLPNTWTPDNTMYAMIHEPDGAPFVMVNNASQGGLSFQPTGRNQWFFHADAWATYFKPNAMGVESPQLTQQNVGTGRPIYQTSFSSFFNDSETAASASPLSWTGQDGVRSYRRTPMGACYAVWAHPKVGGGPAPVGDLNLGWVLSGQTGFISQAQVTLLGGYCTVYIPVIKYAGASGIQLVVQFTDGTNIYNSTGSMNLDELLGNYQSAQPFSENNESTTVESFPAMVYPFVCYSAAPKTLTLKVSRSLGTGSVFVGYPVVLKGACSWFITQ